MTRIRAVGMKMRNAVVIEPADITIGTPDAVLARTRRERLAGLLQAVDDGLAILRMYRLDPAESQVLPGIPTGELAPISADKRGAIPGVSHPVNHRRTLRQRSKATLALLQRIQGLFARGG